MPRKKLVIDEEHVMSLKVVDLRKLCMKYKLAKKGRKAALQNRILEQLQLGKYAKQVEAEPKEESEMETAQTTAQSELEKPKVQGGENQESKVNQSEESKDVAKSLESEDEPKPKQKLSCIENMVTTPDGGQGDDIPENVAIVASNVEEKVLEESDVLIEETVDNNEHKTAGIKRTSSEASISDYGSTIEKKRKTVKNLITEDLTKASPQAGSKEGLESIRPDFAIRPKSGDSNAKGRIKTSSDVEATGTKSKSPDNDEEAFEHKPTHQVVQKNLNIKKKHVGLFSKTVKPEKKAEEVVPKALKLKEHVGEKFSKTTSQAFDSMIKIDDAVPKVIEQKKTDEILSKNLQSNKTELKKKKNILPPKKPTSVTQVKVKKSKSTIADDGRLSKSNQKKKRAKGKETSSNRGYQKKERRDKNRNWNRNKGNREGRNWGGKKSGYQQSYPQSRSSWLFSERSWSGRGNPRMMNSMPLQQQRGWSSRSGWQEQRSYYHGGYGNDRRQPGRNSGGDRRDRGRWQNRRNSWRGNKRGRREKR